LIVPLASVEVWLRILTALILWDDRPMLDTWIFEYLLNQRNDTL